MLKLNMSIAWNGLIEVMVATFEREKGKGSVRMLAVTSQDTK